MKKGFFSKSINVNTSATDGSDVIKKDIFLEEIVRNKSYRLQNIYYEFGKASLTKESDSTLDTLLHLLNENPDIVIELSAHTDNVGTDDYNLKLSQNRAESCVNYLVKHGIDPKRIVPKGYGESDPVAANTNPDGSDNPDGRAKNRRTVFKIIGEMKEGKVLYDKQK